jgi:hypothetical protein
VNYGIMVALVDALDTQVNALNLEFKRDFKVLHNNLKGASKRFTKSLNATLEPEVRELIEEASDQIQLSVFDLQKANGI